MRNMSCKFSLNDKQDTPFLLCFCVYWKKNRDHLHAAASATFWHHNRESSEFWVACRKMTVKVWHCSRALIEPWWRAGFQGVVTTELLKLWTAIVWTLTCLSRLFPHKVTVLQDKTCHRSAPQSHDFLLAVHGSVVSEHQRNGFNCFRKSIFVFFSPNSCQEENRCQIRHLNKDVKRCFPLLLTGCAEEDQSALHCFEPPWGSGALVRWRNPAWRSLGKLQVCT